MTDREAAILLIGLALGAVAHWLLTALFEAAR